MRIHEKGKPRCYGAFLEKSQPEILEMIDLCLDEEFIRLEKRDGYPILLFAERGLAIDIELLMRELNRLRRASPSPHEIRVYSLLFGN